MPPSKCDAVRAEAGLCFFNQTAVFYTITAIIMCRGMCQCSQQAVMYVRWTSQTLPSYQRLLFVRNIIQVYSATLKWRADEVRGVTAASFTEVMQEIKSYCINTSTLIRNDQGHGVIISLVPQAIRNLVYLRLCTVWVFILREHDLRVNACIWFILKNVWEVIRKLMRWWQHFSLDSQTH